MLEEDKQKRRNNKKGKIAETCPKYLWGGWEKLDFAKNGLFKKNWRTLFVFGRRRKDIFVNTICFGKLYFLWFWKAQNTTKIGVSVDEGENRKCKFFWKRAFLERFSKRLIAICDPQKLCSKIVFQHKQFFCRGTGVSSKRENLPKYWVEFQHAKGVFSPSLFGGFGPWLLIWKEPKKAISCNFRGVFSSSPSSPFLKTLPFFLFVFLFFSCVFPFKFHLCFSSVSSSAPFGKTLLSSFGSIFIVSLSFLNVCFFIQTNLPDIPFAKPKLLSVLVIWFFCCFFDYLRFCSLLFCFGIVFCSWVVSLVLLSDFEQKDLFSCFGCDVGSTVVFSILYLFFLSVVLFA